MRTITRIVAMGLLATASAWADPVVGETSVELRVGSTGSLDVGFARGLQCDDLTVVEAQLVAASPTSNRLVMKGLKRGVTACRAGTFGAPTVLVHITVK
jgi:hypothetical protein